MTTRRSFLISTSTLGLVSAFGGAAFSQGRFEVVHTPAEWRQILSEDAYFVMREEQTEPPGYSPLDQEKRAGVFSCAGCDLPVFGSDKKFDSGTGWPSFWGPIDEKALGPRRRARAGFCRLKCIAGAVAATSAISFRTAPSRRACAIASMAWR